jgi:hypothetical protein
MRDQAIHECIRRKKLLMTRCFVIERKSCAGMADILQATVLMHPLCRCGCHACQRPSPGIDRLQCRTCEQMLHIGEQQLLMLLLMLNTQFHQVINLRFVRLSEQSTDTGIHICAPVLDFFKRGSGEQAALRARVFVANGVVIAVEEHAKCGVEGFEARFKALQDEGLKKPGHMRQMPFHR